MQRADQDGAGWGAINTGLPPASAGTSIRFMTSSGSNIVLGHNREGVYRSTNNGTNWAASNTGLLSTEINDIFAVDSRLFAAGETNGFFRSMDNGDTWTAIDSGLVANAGWYTFAKVGTDLLAGCGQGYVYRSSNYGDFWTASNNGLGLTGTFGLAVAGDTVYATGYSGISRSLNSGVDWTVLPSGFSFAQTGLAFVKDGQYLVVGANAGYKRSSDYGDTWTAPITGIPGFGSNFDFALVDTVMFVANSTVGVHRSFDHGATWSLANTGVLGGPVTLVVVGSDLYAGTSSGVWFSNDFGTSWTALNDGFPQNILNVLTLTADGQYLYAGTARRSVWRRPLMSTSITEITTPLPEKFTLEQNFPNPFNPTTTIRFSLLKRSHFKIEVFNALGQHVRLLAEETRSAGTYQVEWDGTDDAARQMSTGIYFYRFTTEDLVESKKMLLVK